MADDHELVIAIAKVLSEPGPGRVADWKRANHYARQLLKIHRLIDKAYGQ